MVLSCARIHKGLVMRDVSHTHMVVVLYAPGLLAAAASTGMYAMPSSSASQAAPTAARPPPV
jgi:hypothetical protein